MMNHPPRLFSRCAGEMARLRAPTIRGSLVLLFGFILSSTVYAQTETPSRILIGWASRNITPPLPVSLEGMPWVRIADRVADPLTATVLVLEAEYSDRPSEPLMLISCDLRSIRNEFRNQVRQAVHAELPEIDPNRIILNATHTHNAPPLASPGAQSANMTEAQYQAFAAPHIAAAAVAAWNNRAPGGISYGLGQAVVGRHRISTYRSGRAYLHGKTDHPDFSHMEGYEDHSVNLIATWSLNSELTGMIINIAAPSQVSRRESFISADFWHETREEIWRHIGHPVYILPQCSAAGDQDTDVWWDVRADERMLRLTGRTRRQEIGSRLAEAVRALIPILRDHIDWKPVLRHEARTLSLPRYLLTESDVEASVTGAQPHRERLEEMQAALDANPELQTQPEWAREYMRIQWTLRRSRAVEDRFSRPSSGASIPVEVHAVRLGDIAMATHPFELYLDYGIRIKARSPAIQTFLVQLAGAGTYLPTARAMAGGAYGADPASALIGPEGGDILVEETLRMLHALWSKPSAP